jgi:hypothetical protein
MQQEHYYGKICSHLSFTCVKFRWEGSFHTLHPYYQKSSEIRTDSQKIGAEALSNTVLLRHRVNTIIARSSLSSREARERDDESISLSRIGTSHRRCATLRGELIVVAFLSDVHSFLHHSSKENQLEKGIFSSLSSSRSSMVRASSNASLDSPRRTRLRPIDEVPLPKLQSQVLQTHTRQHAWTIADARSVDSSTGAALVPTRTSALSVISDVAAEIYDADRTGTEDESPMSATGAQPPTDRSKCALSRRHAYILLLLVGLMLAVVVAIVVVVMATNSNGNDTIASPSSGAPPDSNNTTATSTEERRIRQILYATLNENASVWDDPASPQVRALDWILTIDSLRTSVAQDAARLVQRYALVLLYFATQGDTWLLSPTSSSSSSFLNPAVSECNWTGVTCGENAAPSVRYSDSAEQQKDKVFRLYFQSMNLTGTLPDELGRCIPRLIELDLFNNSLSGTIPSSWFDLETEWYETLYWLDLSQNQLSGTIPSTVWTLQNLHFIFLNQNQLTGPLERHEYSTGDADAGHSNATASELRANLLQQVQLYDNHLTGSIPIWFSELLYLEQWIVFENHLTGSLPDSLPKTIVQFDISFNNISGTIPESFWSESTSPPVLEDLYLDHNFITGTLPNTTQPRQDVTRIWLNDNRLTGTIPENFGYIWTRLSKLQLFHNLLRGRLGPAVVAADLDALCPPKNDTLWPDFMVMIADCLEQVVSDRPPVQCDCCTNCM